MKQKSLMKRVSAVLLATALTISTFPQFHTNVYAAENQLPTEEQFATVEQLKSFNTDDTNDGTKNPAKVYFGNNNQQWWIAGSQSEKGLTLFATNPLVQNEVFESVYDKNKVYNNDWECDYENIPVEVYPNHYGASLLRTTLKGLETSYFTSKEQKLMKHTTIYTDDTKNGNVYSITDKLHLAYGDYDDDKYVTVGKNASDSLNSGLRIDEGYWCNSFFWLRAPRKPYSSNALVARPGYSVTGITVYHPYALVPAFELDLSSVVFASTSSAAVSNGNLSVNNAFILRYKTAILGSALVSYDKSKVTLTDVPKNTYLIVQNSDGAKSKQIINETEVSAKNMNLDNFKNCKIWLEQTDINERITYATLAEEEQGYMVDIKENDGLSIISNNGKQAIGLGKQIKNIHVKADDGFYFPSSYSLSVDCGLKIDMISDTEFIISGTPSADIDITLNSPIQWKEKPISITKFATKEELLTMFDTDDRTKYKFGQKIYFGMNNAENQQWWIAGEQNGNITMFSAYPIMKNQIFDLGNGGNEKNDNELWEDCIYPNDYTPTTVYTHHYGASFIRSTLKDIEFSNFSKSEREMMRKTTVLTMDLKNEKPYYTTDTLYLANAEIYQKYISVGNNNQIRIDSNYWTEDFLWLRNPLNPSKVNVLTTTFNQDHKVNRVEYSNITSQHSVAPAFDLDAANISFASVLPPASGNGHLDEKEAFTLRYDEVDNNVGSALISESNQSVAVTDIANENTYLVVQSPIGAWAKKVSNNDLVFANEIDNSLRSFDGCKVWLEMTDIKERVTYATMAQNGIGKNLKVFGEDISITSDNALQTNIQDSIQDILITTNNEYYFPEGYDLNLEIDLNGLNIERIDNFHLKVSGALIKDTKIELPPVTIRPKAEMPEITVDKTSANSIEVSIAKDERNTYGDIQYKLDDSERWITLDSSSKDIKINGLNAGESHIISVRYAGSGIYISSFVKTQIIQTDSATYEISIPMTVAADDKENRIGIDGSKDFDLGYNGKVNVKIKNTDAFSNGAFTLTRENGNNETITSQLLVGGNPFTDLSQNVATFTDKNAPSVLFVFQRPATSNILAGTYKGTVVFDISYSED